MRHLLVLTIAGIAISGLLSEVSYLSPSAHAVAREQMAALAQGFGSAAAAMHPLTAEVQSLTGAVGALAYSWGDAENTSVEEGGGDSDAEVGSGFNGNSSSDSGVEMGNGFNGNSWSDNSGNGNGIDIGAAQNINVSAGGGNDNGVSVDNSITVIDNSTNIYSTNVNSNNVNSSVDDGGWEDELNIYGAAARRSDPWYVSAFPGFGRVAQIMIPGQYVSYSSYPVIQTIVQPATPYAPPPRYAPQPSCYISAAPTSIQFGGGVALSWGSFNATQAQLTGFGAVPVGGSRTASNLAVSQTFTLAVAGPGGSNSCYTRVYVAPPAGPPSCIISAHPDSIRRGEQSVLAWGSQNAVAAGFVGFGAVSPQGSTVIAPSQSTTYTLSVRSASGDTASCSARIIVK